MQKSLLCLVVLSIWSMAGLAQADLFIQGYTPAENERFQNDPQFIGNLYDWSGIGRTVDPVTPDNLSNENRRWATLVSPSYAITATHFPAVVGSTLAFYTDNSGATRVTRTVASVTQMGTSDVSLLRLSAPIAPGQGVTYYPVLQLPSPGDYVGQDLLVWGASGPTLGPTADASMRLGTNVVSAVDLAFSAPGLGAIVSDVFVFDLNPGVDSEARAEPFDSGAPTFADRPGGPAILGLHWFVYSAEVGTLAGTGDSLVPNYIAALNQQMAADFGLGLTASLEQITAVPEPSSFVLLGMTVAVSTFRRRRSQVMERP